MRLSLVLMLAFLAGAATAAERAKVHLFQYGFTSSGPAKSAFEDFRYLLGEKLPRLASELQDEDGPEGIVKLAVKPVKAGDGQQLARPNDLIAGLDERRDYWRDTGALTLLTGTVRPSADGEGLEIHSTLFLGEIGEALGRETIDIQLALTAKTFDTTNDSHSVAILYAYAGQIAPDCARQADTFALLSAAHLRAASVAEDNPALGLALTEKIDAALADVETRCAG